MISEILLKTVIGEAVKQLTKVAGLVFRSSGKPGERLEVRTDLSERALSHHLAYVDRWSSQISLKDLPESRELIDVFVPLTFAQGLNRKIASRVDLDYLTSPGIHKVVLGHPGAGKTTTIKKICQVILHEPDEREDAFAFPLLVRFLDLKPPETLVDHVLGLTGIAVELPDVSPGASGEPTPEARLELLRSAKEQLLVSYLNGTKALLLLDGLDEVHHELYQSTLRELSRLANLLTASSFVLTCRHGSLDATFDNSTQLFVSPFDSAQIAFFAEKWFGSSARAGEFLAAVARTPYRDTIGRPLILVNLCMVYEAYDELPEQPTLVYQRLVHLHLEEWDRQRDIRRVSVYGRFGPERKRQFLSALAYDLSTRSHSATAFDEGELKGAFARVHTRFALRREDRSAVLREIESHTGLFVQAGLGKCEFSHKSIQEFLCADHVSRIPNLGDEVDKLLQLPDECAIATVLSASPTEFIRFLVANASTRAERSELVQYWKPYLTRLLVERGTFDISADFGAVIVTLASFAWQRVGATDQVQRAKGGEELEALLNELCAAPDVMASVRLAGVLLYRQASSENCVRLAVKAIKKSGYPGDLPQEVVLSRDLAKHWLEKIESQ